MDRIVASSQFAGPSNHLGVHSGHDLHLVQLGFRV